MNVNEARMSDFLNNALMDSDRNGIRSSDGSVDLGTLVTPLGFQIWVARGRTNHGGYCSIDNDDSQICTVDEEGQVLFQGSFSETVTFLCTYVPDEEDSDV